MEFGTNRHNGYTTVCLYTGFFSLIVGQAVCYRSNIVPE